MGKGVAVPRNRDKNHFIRVDADEWQKAIAVLDANKPEGVL
ncbi:transketolase [Salmonella enterica subsp. enterica]|uniref:Transketolase n=1 Tax=Salmonella enterica I TaxID=59201 RepID=A0A379VV97_SALET|nr:transketolase [Salmonella enterica subsp. enterica]